MVADPPGCVGRSYGKFCYPVLTMTVSNIAAALAAAPGVTLLRSREADGYDVDGLRPPIVARPSDAAGVGAVLRLASEHDLRVVPRGGGTAINLGNVPSGLDIVLDLSGMTQMVEYRPRDLTVTVEAGMTVAAVQRVLDADGQLLALDPPLPERATIGGTLAADLTGPRRYRYGTARDILTGTAAVLADGTHVRSGGRVVKNVAGYDLNKLFIGSLGTLGVITQATFKLIPAPPARGMVAAQFATLEQADSVAKRVAGSTLAPLSLDLVNPVAARALADTLPSAAAEHWLLVAELGGTRATVERTRTELLRIVRDAGGHGAEVPPASRETLYTRLRDFGHAAEHATSLVLRAAALPSLAAQVSRLIADAANAAGVEPAVVARAGNGAVLSYWPIAEPDAVRALVRGLREGLRLLAGILVVERCPAAAKDTLDMWGIAGPDVALMRRVKQAFDPAGILSPGRGAGGL